MALVQVNFISQSLKRTVSMNVILPVDKFLFKGNCQPVNEYKTLYLLHGLLGNYTDWVTRTRIQEWAEAKNLVVVMPSGDNSFYVDQEVKNNDFAIFIGTELIEVTRRMFHLSNRRDDTFIAGLSMGGFGALRNGLKYYQNFGYIAALSSALNIFELPVHDESRCVMGEDSCFGDIDEAYLSDKNPKVCLENLIQAKKEDNTIVAFTSKHILGAILFEKTMDSQIEGVDTAEYLWLKKEIVPFLKIDKGLEVEKDGVQLMKPIPELEAILNKARDKYIFGTKMRSVILEADPAGIKKIVDQQFELGLQIAKTGLVPILEPEVSILSTSKKEAEELLLKEINEHLTLLDNDVKFIFKLSIPTIPDFYAELMKDSHVVRVVALSGGYDREQANGLLRENHGLIASFSRVLLSDLSINQTSVEFDTCLENVILQIYRASIV